MIVRLQAAFREALRGCQLRRRQVFLDIFGGTGGVSAEVKKLGYASVCVEVNLGDHFDMSCDAVVRTLCGWISSGAVSATVLAPPCGTWSRARHGPVGTSWGPLRSSEHVHGLPSLSEKDRLKVQEGNHLAQAAVKIIKACLRMNVPCGLENPSQSFLWQSRYLRGVVERRNATTYDFDFCRFGAPWRKRTRVVLWSCLPWADGHLRCKGRRSICSVTNKRHIVLTGTDPQGVLWTKRAQAYPESLCTSLASLLTRSAEHITLQEWTRLATKVRLL